MPVIFLLYKENALFKILTFKLQLWIITQKDICCLIVTLCFVILTCVLFYCHESSWLNVAHKVESYLLCYMDTLQLHCIFSLVLTYYWSTWYKPQQKERRKIRIVSAVSFLVRQICSPRTLSTSSVNNRAFASEIQTCFTGKVTESNPWQFLVLCFIHKNV